MRGQTEAKVFPTPVGVFHFFQSRTASGISLPHARGGVSPVRDKLPTDDRSSPRPWGCFFSHSSSPFEGSVFPTPVGVFLSSEKLRGVLTGLPHARGGVSLEFVLLRLALLSSPRPWGCFRDCSGNVTEKFVFPTPVGVFPRLPLVAGFLCRLPHARGGVSAPKSDAAHDGRSSPRPWGCFSAVRFRAVWSMVFPTPVGVFLTFSK